MDIQPRPTVSSRIAPYFNRLPSAGSGTAPSLKAAATPRATARPKQRGAKYSLGRAVRSRVARCRMPMRVRELIQLLEKNGWKEMRSRGSHRHFKHPEQSSLITVPGSDGKELAPGTLNAILKKSGLK